MKARVLDMTPRGDGRTKGKVQPLNLLVPQTVNVSSGIKEYGRGNTLPNLLLDIVADSGTATACVEKRAEYIKADGFTDKNFSAFKVNEDQTADDILEEIASYMGIFPGSFALVVHHSATPSEPAKVRVLPFEHIRRKENGDFIYNPTYSSKGKYSRQKEVLYPAYKPELKPEERLTRNVQLFNTKDEAGQYIYRDQKTGDFIGELWYIFSPKARQPDYPVPGWVAGDWDIKTDAELSKYEYEQVDNSFMGTTVFQTRVYDDQNKDEHGKTELDHFDDQLNSLRGTGNRGGILHLQAKSKEEFAEVTVLNPTQAAEDLDTKQDYIGRKVCRHFRVPPPLVGFSRPGQLGDVQELVNSVTLLNNSVNPDQRVIQRVMETLFPGGDRSISTFNPISQIPPEVFAKLTDDEIRALSGYPPIDKSTSTEQQNVLNALNSLSPLVANKVLESMSQEEVRKLIGLGPAPALPPPTPLPNGTTN